MKKKNLPKNPKQSQDMEPSGVPLKGFPLKKAKNVGPADIIDRGYVYIKNEGWTQGTLERDFSRCILGAIQAAAQDLGLTPGSPVLQSAERFILLSIAGSGMGGGRSIPVWNDAKGRKASQVLDVMDRAAALALSAEEKK